MMVALPRTDRSSVAYLLSGFGTRAFRTFLQLAVGVGLALAAAHTAIGAPSVSITADPPIIAAGSHATLRWSATGANACVASGSWAGAQPLTGELVLTPAAAGVYPYALTCTGAQGTSGRDSVILQVTASGFQAGDPMFVFMSDFTTQAPEALPLPFTGVGWGWYPQGAAVDDNLKAHVALWKAQKGLYITAINLNRLYGAAAPANWDASRLRALDGSYLPDRYSGGAPTYTISSPDWQAFLRAQAKNSVDAGADGMLIDDIRSDVAYMSGLTAQEAVSFDAFTMAAFRAYLQRTYTPQQLQARFGIADVSAFDYGTYIKVNGLAATWNNQPLKGLALEFYRFRVQESRDFLRDLISTTKAYAKSQYGHDFLFTCNDNDDPIGYFTADVMDLTSPELFYIRGMGHPFAAIDIKAFQGWRSPTIPIAEAMPVELGVVNPLTKATANLERIIIADLQAAGGIPGATLTMNYGLSVPEPVDLTVVRRYANFVLANGALLTRVATHARTALIQSASSMRGSILDSPGEARAFTGGHNYFGTAMLLLDSGITYDSIFLPDTSYSTLPSLTSDRLAPYDVVIAPSVWALDDNQLAVLLGFAQGGGTLVIDGSFASSQPDASAANRPDVQALIAKIGTQSYGAGRIVVTKTEFGVLYEGNSVAGKRVLRATYQNFLAPFLTPDVTVTQPPAVIQEPGIAPFFYRDASANALVHLVNYDYDDALDAFNVKTNISVTVNVGDQVVDEVTIRSPDVLGVQVLPFTRSGGSVTVTVPRVEAWSILYFQRNNAPPVIAGSSPAPVTGVVGGSTVTLTVDAQDADGNPLAYIWTVNGQQVPDVFGPSYTLQTSRTGGGPFAVTVSVSDGSQTVQWQWIVTVVPYKLPQVLFDETHGERNTIDSARASQLNPQHPDWVLFGVLAQSLVADYQLARLTGGSITAQALANIDVLVMAAPTSALSSDEIAAIRSFVYGGGGLIFVGDAGADESINSVLGPLGVAFDGKGRIKSPQNPNQPENFKLTTFEVHPALGRSPSFVTNWGGRLTLSGGVNALGLTSAAEWWGNSSALTQQPGEPNGPFAMITAVTYGNGRIYGISDNAFHDSYLQSAYSSGNLGLFRAALDWASANANPLPIVATAMVEYYNQAQDHYFMTWLPHEIAVLDAGTTIRGWARTGRSFQTYTAPLNGTSPVCRFYIPPLLGDSHFFGRGMVECNATAQKNPTFILEDPAFMQMYLPVAGVCPPNTTEVYRVFDNRLDANHRYMTDRSVRDQMVAKGWVAEGDGPNLVVMCAPQ